MDSLEKELTLDMITGEIYRTIAEEIGVENFLKLSKLVGGATFYIPKAESILRPVRDLHIKQEFNGYNYQELAIRYDVTERWVRQICGSDNLVGQMTIFDIKND